MEKLREFIRVEMLRQGLTEWQIQKRAEDRITDSYIKDILSGKTKSIGVDKLNALAQGLGADSLMLYKLVSGENVVTQRKDKEMWTARGLVKLSEKILDEPDVTAILRIVLGMTAKERSALLAYLRKK